MAAFIISNAGGNWAATGTWVNGVVPGAADAVTATGTSGNISILTSGGAPLTTAACLSLNLTNYAGTFNIPASSKLTVTGAVTLAGTTSGTGTLSIGVSTTTSSIAASCTLVPLLRFEGSGTKTLTTPLTVTGLVTFATTAACVLNGSSTNKLVCNGGLTMSAAYTITGTAHIDVSAGTLTSAGSTAILAISGYLTCTAAVTLSAFYFKTGRLVSTAANFVSGNLYLCGNCELDLAGATFPGTIYATGSPTITLIGSFTAATLNIASSSATVINGAYTISLTTALTVASALTGTATLSLGTTTWTGSSTGTVSNAINLTGTVNLSTAYLKGALTQSGTGRLGTGVLYVSFGAGVSIDIANATYGPYDLNLQNGAALSLGSPLTVRNSLTVASGTATLSTNDLVVTSGLTMTGALNGQGITLKGGTWSGAGILNSNLTIDGNITMASGAVYFGGSNAPYLSQSSGTGPGMSGNTFNIAGNCAISAALTFNIIGCTAMSTLTLQSSIVCASLTLGTSALTTSATDATITAGSLTCSNGSISGTAKLILTGGTWSSAGSSGFVGCDLDLAGAITVSGSVYFSGAGKTLHHVSGAIATTGSTLNIIGGAMLDTSTMSWGTMGNAAGDATVTLLSDLAINTALAGPYGMLTFTSSSTVKYVNLYGNWSGGGNITGNAFTVLRVMGNASTLSGYGTLGINTELAGSGVITINQLKSYHTDFTVSYDGVPDLAGTMNLVVGGSGTMTINAAGVPWGAVTNIASGTLRSTSDFVCASITPASGLTLTIGCDEGTFTCAALLVVAGATLACDSVGTLAVSTTCLVTGNLASTANMTVTAGQTTALTLPASAAASGFYRAAVTRMTSTPKVYLWNGTATDCVNIIAATSADIGGGGWLTITS